MLNELSKFCFENNFKVENNFAYGIYKDRTLSIVEKGSYVKVSVGFNSQISREVGMQVSTKLKELKEKHRALQHALTTNVCIELIVYKSADFGIEFHTVLQDALNILDQHIPAMVDVCPICGQVKPLDSPFVRIKDTVIQGHDHCIEQLVGASSQMGSDILLKFNKIEFFKTLLVALLVLLVVTGVVGIASYYGMFGMVSALAGWAVYLIVSVLLRKMNIQIGRTQIIIVSIFALLAVFASTYFGSIIHIFRSSENVTLKLVFEEYFLLISQNMDTLGKFVLIDLGIGLLFVVPTMINNFIQIKQRVNAIKKLK